jgi:Mn2+/Fe2+ NRAMP family transporter
MSKRFPKPLVIFSGDAAVRGEHFYNLGADVAAMGAATQLLAGGHQAVYSVAFGAISLLLQIFVPYRKYLKYLKWLTVSLFAYFATAFVSHIPWAKYAGGRSFHLSNGSALYWTALVAVLGTTISPYLFFWQTSQETEELKAHKSEAPLKRTPWQALRAVFGGLQPTPESEWHFPISWRSPSFWPLR